MNPRISVIVPIYNVEDYIEKCIDSILDQTFYDIEIILVDDGSSDKCPAICDRYAKLDSRIIVLHKNNGGVASARNAGLKVATGEYICFIDSDDYIDKNMFKDMVFVFSDPNVGVVGCGVREIHQNGNIKVLPMMTGKTGAENAIKHLLLWDGEVRSFSCNKMFRKSIVENCQFDNDLRYGEDTPFVFMTLMRSAQYYQIENVYYNYVQRENSLVREQFNKRKLSTIEASKRIYEYCQKNARQYMDYAACSILMNCYFLLSQLVLVENWRNAFKNEYDIIRREMKGYPAKVIWKHYGPIMSLKWGCARFIPTIFEVGLKIKHGCLSS